MPTEARVAAGRDHELVGIAYALTAGGPLDLGTEGARPGAGARGGTAGERDPVGRRPRRDRCPRQLAGVTRSRASTSSGHGA